MNTTHEIKRTTRDDGRRGFVVLTSKCSTCSADRSVELPGQIEAAMQAAAFDQQHQHQR